MTATDVPGHSDPGGTPAQISIIIPHYNDIDNLRLCLAALRRQAGVPGYEIVVADNNSRCARSDLEEACGSGVRLVDAPIQGAAAARNAGIAAASAPLLALIDSDCRPAADWLANGLASLAQHELVGGQVIVSVPDRHALSASEAFELVFAFNNARYIREERFSVTANMFLKRSVFDRVGGFKAGVSEDVEWGQRAADLGFRWHYAPEARVEHPARRDWPELRRKWHRLAAESFALFRHRRGSRTAWILRNWLAFLSVPLALGKVLRSREIHSLSDRLKAAGILIRLRAWRLGEAHRLAFRVA